MYSLKVPVGDPRFGRMFDCECTAAYRAAQLQMLCGLNDEERRVRLSDVIDAGPGTVAMKAAAQSFIDQPFGFLTLWGGAGNAKTLVLQACVNESLERGSVAVYVTFYDLVSFVREAFNETSDGRYESAYKRMRRYATCSILAIDEVDKVKITDWAQELQTAIFDLRYRDGLARRSGTILAMNSDPDHLPEWVYSRLSDGRNRIIHNPDPDMRRLMR